MPLLLIVDFSKFNIIIKKWLQIFVRIILGGMLEMYIFLFCMNQYFFDGVANIWKFSLLCELFILEAFLCLL